MVRYIDAEKIDFKLGVPLQDANGDLYISLRDVIKAIAQTPTEDVVPKSIFERPNKMLDSYLLHYGLVDKRGLIDEAKREVAKEIFEEITDKLRKCVGEAIKGIDIGVRNGNERQMLTNLDAKIVLDALLICAAELKKKYTEG